MTLKYRNVPTRIDGIRFPSKREARRYQALKLMEKAGAIRDLKLQVRYPLTVNGIKVGTYVADFDYIEGEKRVTEDVKAKPTMTPAYKLKRRLMYAIHGVVIKEVV